MKKETKATQEETPVVAQTETNADVETNTAVSEETTTTKETTETEEARILGVKVVTDEEENIEVQEATVLDPLSFISRDGEEYEVTVPKFRFRGQEYDSQKAIDETPEVLEVLIQANSFFIVKKDD